MGLIVCVCSVRVSRMVLNERGGPENGEANGEAGRAAGRGGWWQCALNLVGGVVGEGVGGKKREGTREGEGVAGRRRCGGPRARGQPVAAGRGRGETTGAGPERGVESGGPGEAR